MRIAGVYEAVLGEEPNIVIPLDGVTATVRDGNLLDDLDNDPAPADGCTQLEFASYLTGKIALFDSTPECSAAEQARWSQVEAAAGVIIAAITDSGLPDVSGRFTTPQVTIPYIGVEKSVGLALRDYIETADITIRISDNWFRAEMQTYDIGIGEIKDVIDAFQANVQMETLQLQNIATFNIAVAELSQRVGIDLAGR